MDIQIILSQMVMLFAMMMIGYGVWKKGWLDENSYQKLSKIVVNIFNPLLVIYGVVGKSSEGNIRCLLENLVLVAIFYFLLWMMGYVILLLIRPKEKEKTLYRLMTMFPNVGFMGIPVITGIFGTESMIYIVFYMLVYNLLIYTYGIILAEKAGKHQEIKRKGIQWKRIMNAGVLASLAAVAIFLFQIPVPEMVVGFCDYIGNATIPLSMLLIGASIAKVNLKVIFTTVKVYAFTLIRMVLFPIAVILILKNLLSVDSVVFGVFALQLAMPVGSIVTLIAKENGADEACCTNGIVLSTLLSIITIPLVCMFL